MTSISATEYAIVVVVWHTFLLSTFGLLVVPSLARHSVPFHHAGTGERKMISDNHGVGAVRSKHLRYMEFSHQFRDVLLRGYVQMAGGFVKDED